MTNYFAQATSPWQQNAQAVGAVGDSINQLLVGLAQQKFQQQQAQQMMALRQQELAQQNALTGQRAGLLDAQTAYYRAQQMLEDQKLKSEQQKTGGAADFGQLMQHITQAQQNPMMPYSMDRLQGMAVGKAGELAALGQDKLPVNMAQLMQVLNPRSQLLMATGAEPLQYARNDGVVMNPVTGQPEFATPATLRPGEVSMDLNTGQTLASAPFEPFNPLRNMGSMGWLGSLYNNLQTQVAEKTRAGMEPSAEDTANLRMVEQALMPVLKQIQQGAQGAPAAQASAQSKPNIDEARREAQELISKHPAKADAIRKRFQDTFNQPL